MNTVWARRREELLSDCIVSPDVFYQMVDRLGEFVIPYQTGAGDRGRPTQRPPLPPGAAVPLAWQECRGHCDVRRYRATGHARIHGHRTLGPPAVDRGVGGSSG